MIFNDFFFIVICFYFHLFLFYGVNFVTEKLKMLSSCQFRKFSFFLLFKSSYIFFLNIDLSLLLKNDSFFSFFFSSLKAKENVNWNRSLKAKITCSIRYVNWTNVWMNYMDDRSWFCQNSVLDLEESRWFRVRYRQVSFCFLIILTNILSFW